MANRSALYEIVDGDEVIYVGVGVKPQTRFIYHRAKGKLPEGATLRVIRWYDNRKEALRAEMAAIAEKSPRLNFVGRRDMTKATGLVPIWKEELVRAQREKEEKARARIERIEREVMEHIAARMPADAGPWRFKDYKEGHYIVQTEAGQVFRIPQ